MKLQPLNDWLLVKMDKLVDRGPLVSLHGPRVRTGTVVSVGPGRKSRRTGAHLPVGLEVGERIAFFREHLEHKQGKALVGALTEVGENLGLLRIDDVMFAFTGELDVSS
jgi:co-chaperonin GroES (HSP10)